MMRRSRDDRSPRRPQLGRKEGSRSQRRRKLTLAGEARIVSGSGESKSFADSPAFAENSSPPEGSSIQRPLSIRAVLGGSQKGPGAVSDAPGPLTPRSDEGAKYRGVSVTSRPPDGSIQQCLASPMTRRDAEKSAEPPVLNPPLQARSNAASVRRPQRPSAGRLQPSIRRRETAFRGQVRTR